MSTHDDLPRDQDRATDRTALSRTRRPSDPLSDLLAISSPRAGWAWLSTIYIGAILVSISWPVLANVHGVHVAIAMVLALATSGALVLAVRWPVPSIALALAGALGTAFAASTSAPWPWPVPTMIAFLLTIAVLVLRHGWLRGAGLLGGGMLVSLLSLLVLHPGTDGALANAIVCAGVGGGILAAASGLGALVRSREDLAQERRARRDESGRRTELQERNRIAQEMHDVVAHSMSVISVQATTAPFRLPDMAPEVQSEFTSIASSSRSALTEMRGLLAVLRGSEDADLAPQPGVHDIPALVEASRSSGATIGLDVTGAGVESVPPATGLTAYRVVQEALSNALRHSPGSAVEVSVRTSEEFLSVEIVNGPADEEASPAAPGAGLGLSGIRERTRALGGVAETGPTPGGGFAVRATLPLG
ncbi:MAG: sensor histidine kinase [Actinomycetales bacterium]